MRPLDNLWFTAAYSYTKLDGDISVCIIGADYDSMYGDPILATLQSNDHGILNLAGMAQTHEHIGNLNVLWEPVKHLTAIAGFRYTHEEKDAFSTFLDTNTTANVAPFTPANPQGGFHQIPNPTPRAWRQLRRIQCRRDLRTALQKVVENGLLCPGRLDGRMGQRERARGRRAERPRHAQQRHELFAQKDTAGINWYPMAGLNFATQYYQETQYDNDFKTDLAAPPSPGAERNQRLLNQQWDTDNFNIRMTWRPTLPQTMDVFDARDDYQRANIDGQWSISPLAPPVNGLNGTTLDEVRSGIITQHIFTEKHDVESLPAVLCPGRFFLRPE